MPKKKIRPLGNIMLDIEPFLEELVDAHDVQVSDLIGLITSWTVTHRPGACEEYLDGSNPILYTHTDFVKYYSNKKIRR